MDVIGIGFHSVAQARHGRAGPTRSYRPRRRRSQRPKAAIAKNKSIEQHSALSIGSP
jgi:hypothetical protein